MALILIEFITLIITFVGHIRVAWRWVWRVLFHVLLTLFLLIASLSFRLSVFLSLEKSDFLDDESDDDGSDSGSFSKCSFRMPYDDSVGCVCGFCSEVFLPTGIESKCDVLGFLVFVPIGVESKGGQLIEKKLALKLLVKFHISNSVLKL